MHRQIQWNAQAADFKAAVEALSNVEEVEVTKDEWTNPGGFDYYHWTVRDARLRSSPTCLFPMKAESLFRNKTNIIRTFDMTDRNLNDLRSQRYWAPAHDFLLHSSHCY